VIGDLWRYYDEHAAQARQHETLRATVTGALGGFAVALVGFAGVGGLEAADAPAGVLLIVFGLLGAPLSLKHYERNRFHTEVMGSVRKEIATLRANPKHGPVSTGVLRERAKTKHNQEFSLRGRGTDEMEKPRPASPLVRIRLWPIWAAFPIAIAVVGVVILIASLISGK
jgi:hypothetical protein